MVYRFKTKKALKFWLWLSMGLDAMLVCFFSAIMKSDAEMAVLCVIGFIAMAVQIVHGVRVAFFNKTLVNMSLGFCKFQFWLFLLFAHIVACDIGGTSGKVLFAVALVQFAVAAVISKRREIVTAIREFLII